MYFRKIFFYIILTSIVASCGTKVPKYDPNEKISDEAKDTLYFSVKEFLNDQWKNKGHLPYTLTRITVNNKKSDTAFIAWDSAFHTFRGAFDSTDIASSRFLKLYHFSVASEESLGITNLTYEALNPDLFTQKLVVGMDDYNQRVRTLYIETREKKWMSYRTQKLTYIPDRAIQIQTFRSSRFSGPKETIITYKFAANDNTDE